MFLAPDAANRVRRDWCCELPDQATPCRESFSGRLKSADMAVSPRIIRRVSVVNRLAITAASSRWALSTCGRNAKTKKARRAESAGFYAIFSRLRGPRLTEA